MRRLVSGAAVLLAAGLAFAAPESGIRILSDRTLPQKLGTVSDLRWASADSLFLTAGKGGALRLRFEPEWGEPELLVPAGKSLWAAARVGASSRYLAVGAPAHSVAWRKLPAGELQATQLDMVVDLDVFENRIVLLGARKGERGEFAPDGAIAWTGSLDKNLADLKPVLYSAAGPGARPMDACGAFETGAVRFLKDGSFLVAPGVEPGIFLYDHGGKLLRTWEAREAGLDAECGLDDEQMQLLSASLGPRSAWINQRRVLDDIVVLPEGAGLLVRQVSNGRTSWQIKTLKRDGKITSRTLPFTGQSPHWHLRADVHDKRIAFLLKEYAVSSPPAPSRLIVTTLVE